MNDKFCLSKKFLLGFITGIIVVSTIYFIGKIIFFNSPQSKAAGVICNKNKLTYACTGGKTVDYYLGYVNNKQKYYKDANCYQEVIEGLGNYCKNSVNTTGCKISYCSSPNGS